MAFHLIFQSLLSIKGPALDSPETLNRLMPQQMDARAPAPTPADLVFKLNPPPIQNREGAIFMLMQNGVD